MNIETRIRRSWAELVGQLSYASDPRSFVITLRDWLHRSPGKVSRHVREGLSDSQAVKLVLEGPPENLALPLEATQVIGSLEVPKDPKEFAGLIGKVCWDLAVYSRKDDLCPLCQGDLELWWDDGKLLECCGLLGCDRGPNQMSARDLSRGARPANREEVLLRYPKAQLFGIERKGWFSHR